MLKLLSLAIIITLYVNLSLQLSGTWRKMEEHSSSEDGIGDRNGFEAIQLGYHVDGVQQKALVFGGFDSNGDFHNDLHQLRVVGSSDQYQWTQLDYPNAPTARAFYGSTYAGPASGNGGLGVLIGGVTYTEFSQDEKEDWCYFIDYEEEEWIDCSYLEGDGPDPRASPVVVHDPVSGDVFVFGGIKNQLIDIGGGVMFPVPITRNDFYRLEINYSNPLSSRWYKINFDEFDSNDDPVPVPDPRLFATATSMGGQLVMYGGEYLNPATFQFSYYDDTWRFDFTALNGVTPVNGVYTLESGWTEDTRDTPDPLRYQAAPANDGTVFWNYGGDATGDGSNGLCSGNDLTENPVSDLWLYTIADGWSEATITGTTQPPALKRLGGAYLKQEFRFFGGYNIDYDPNSPTVCQVIPNTDVWAFDLASA